MSDANRKRVLVREPVRGGPLELVFDWDVELLARVRTIPGRHWHACGRYWTVPGGEAGPEQVVAVFGAERVRFAAAPLAYPQWRKLLTVQIVLDAKGTS